MYFANARPQRHQHIKYELVILALLALTLNSETTSAQSTQDAAPVKHGIGLYGGYITGSGLTYIHYFGSHILQASFLADVDRTKHDYSVGLSYARYLHHVRHPASMLPVSLKFVTGADVRYQSGYVERDIISNQDPWNNNDKQAYFYHAGAGLGIDFWHPGLPGITFSLVLTYAISFEEVNNKREWQISPLPAAGIIYSW